MRLDRLADDRVGLLAQGRRDGRAIRLQVSDGGEPGQHPVHRIPDRRRGRAEQRRATDDGLADGLGEVGTRETADLDELVGQPPLVQQHHLLRLQPKRASPRRGRAAGRPGEIRGVHGRCCLGSPEERAGHPGRALAQGTRGPDDRRRGLHRVGGKGSEEPPAGKPLRLVEVRRAGGAGRGWLGRPALLVGQRPVPDRARVSR